MQPGILKAPIPIHIATIQSPNMRSPKRPSPTPTKISTIGVGLLMPRAVVIPFVGIIILQLAFGVIPPANKVPREG